MKLSSFESIVAPATEFLGGASDLDLAGPSPRNKP